MLDKSKEYDFRKRPDERNLLHTEEEQEDERIIVLNVNIDTRMIRIRY
jgi:hypothetical protein